MFFPFGWNRDTAAVCYAANLFMVPAFLSKRDFEQTGHRSFGRSPAIIADCAQHFHFLFRNSRFGFGALLKCWPLLGAFLKPPALPVVLTVVCLLRWVKLEAYATGSRTKPGATTIRTGIGPA